MSTSPNKSVTPITHINCDPKTNLPFASDDVAVTNRLQDLRIPMPMDVLPERTRAVLEEVKEDKNRAGEEMILATLLSTASFAAGVGYSVVNPANIYRPLPALLSFMISSPSGGGKTTIGEVFKRPIAQAVRNVAHQIQEVQSEEGVLEITSLQYSVDPLISETTATGLAKALTGGPRFLFNCDGADMTGGYGTREEPAVLASIMCKSWSREMISNRRSDEKNNVYCPSPQLTGLIMAQELPVRSFYATPEFANIGVHARWLPVISEAKPADDRATVDDETDALYSMRGTQAQANQLPLLDALQDKIRRHIEAHLMEQKRTGDFDFESLPVFTWADREATKVFVEYRRQTEDRQVDEDEDSMLKRAPEHALRIAAVLAFIENDELVPDERNEVPVLTADLVRAGCRFTDHFMKQLHALTSSRVCSQKEQTGDALLQWLRKKTYEQVEADGHTPKAFKWTVRSLRTRTHRTSHEQSTADFRPLLQYLEDEGKIRIESYDKFTTSVVFHVLPWEGLES